MTQTVIQFPNSTDLRAILDFCSAVEAQGGNDIVRIDFSRMGRIEPFTMVYVAKFIRNFNYRFKETTVRCGGFKNKTYAANMAFFRAFGLKHGNEPSHKVGNNRFVPFTILRVKTIVDEAMEEWEQEQQVIERKSEQLAKILSQECSGKLFDALTFSIREIMRNVFEHSESKSIEYCAQYWPSYNRVEISIADSGLGLRESLSKNPHIDASNDADAIQQALMPAISSKNYEGAIIDTSDPWHNSGFGLYMSSRLCRLGGNFTICSGDHGIRLDKNGKTHLELGHQCKGTVVRMVLNTAKLTELETMLSRFRDQGYERAKQIKGVGVYSASAASLMLSRDFGADA